MPSSATSSIRRTSRISTTSTPRRPRAARSAWCRPRGRPISTSSTPSRSRAPRPTASTALMFDSLLTGNFDEPTTAYGLLAEDVEVAPDRLSATFRLRRRGALPRRQAGAGRRRGAFVRTLISEKAAPQFRTIYAEVKRAVDGATRARCASTSSAQPRTAADRRRHAGVQPRVGQGQALRPGGLGGADRLRPVPHRQPAAWGATSPTCATPATGRRTCRCAAASSTSTASASRSTWTRPSRFEGLKAGEFDFMREFISRNWARQYKGKQFDTGELIKRDLREPQPGRLPGLRVQPAQAQVPGHPGAPGDRSGHGLRVDEPAAVLRPVQARARLFPEQRLPCRGPAHAGRAGAAGAAARPSCGPRCSGRRPFRPAPLPPDSLRDNLRQAQALLAEAGWTYRDGALRNAKGEAFTIEFLNDQPSWCASSRRSRRRWKSSASRLSLPGGRLLAVQAEDGRASTSSSPRCASPARGAGRRTAGAASARRRPRRHGSANSGASPTRPWMRCCRRW